MNFYATVLCMLYVHVNVSAGLPNREDRCLVCKPVFSAAKCHSDGTAQFSSFHLSIMLMLPTNRSPKSTSMTQERARVYSPPVVI